MKIMKRGYLALGASLVLALLNLAGIWIAGLLCTVTYPLAFHDLYIAYERYDRGDTD